VNVLVINLYWKNESGNWKFGIWFKSAHFQYIIYSVIKVCLDSSRLWQSQLLNQLFHFKSFWIWSKVISVLSWRHAPNYQLHFEKSEAAFSPLKNLQSIKVKDIFYHSKLNIIKTYTSLSKFPLTRAQLIYDLSHKKLNGIFSNDFCHFVLSLMYGCDLPWPWCQDKFFISNRILGKSSNYVFEKSTFAQNIIGWCLKLAQGRMETPIDI
jgi:hypothetical protein